MSKRVDAVDVPDWAFEMARAIAVERAPHFKNQFKSSKLRGAVSAFPDLIPHVEGIFGYLGDICASCFLGVDPIAALRRMLIDTDLLTRRDAGDLGFRGYVVDVKTEEVDGKLDAILERRIHAEEPYGSRLINANQYKQNSQGIDIYLFGAVPQPNVRELKTWHPVGWLWKDEVVAKALVPTSAIGARRLEQSAYAIPTDQLRATADLLAVPPGTRPLQMEEDLLSRKSPEFKAKFNALCQKLKLGQLAS